MKFRADQISPWALLVLVFSPLAAIIARSHYGTVEAIPNWMLVVLGIVFNSSFLWVFIRGVVLIVDHDILCCSDAHDRQSGRTDIHQEYDRDFR